MYDGECVADVSARLIVSPIDDSLISVLHVEEEHLVSKVIKGLPELEGKFQVDTVCPVQEAYKKLNQRPYMGCRASRVHSLFVENSAPSIVWRL